MYDFRGLKWHINLGYEVLCHAVEASTLNAHCSGNRVPTAHTDRPWGTGMVGDLLIEDPGSRRVSGLTHPPGLPRTGERGGQLGPAATLSELRFKHSKRETEDTL